MNNEDWLFCRKHQRQYPRASACMECSQEWLENDMQIKLNDAKQDKKSETQEIMSGVSSAFKLILCLAGFIIVALILSQC